MKHLLDVLWLALARMGDSIDRMLCTKTPWYFRLWWRALWIRKDPHHPSLDRDYCALVLKKRFFTRQLRRTLARKRSTPRSLTPRDELHREGWKVVELEKRIQKEYDDDLERRREIVRKRDSKNDTTQNPSE